MFSSCTKSLHSTLRFTQVRFKGCCLRNIQPLPIRKYHHNNNHNHSHQNPHRRLSLWFSSSNNGHHCTLLNKYNKQFSSIITFHHRCHSNNNNDNNNNPKNAENSEKINHPTHAKPSNPNPNPEPAQKQSDFNTYFSKEFQHSPHFNPNPNPNPDTNTNHNPSAEPFINDDMNTNADADDDGGGTKTQSPQRRLRRPKGERKSEKQFKKAFENRQLKFEYKLIKVALLGLGCLIAFYVYNMFGSSVGKADNYYKLAMDYELDENYAKADDCYQQCIAHTNMEFPKYLYEYSKFLWRKLRKFEDAQLYILQAIQLHPTNASYHRFYTHLLEQQHQRQHDDGDGDMDGDMVGDGGGDGGGDGDGVGDHNMGNTHHQFRVNYIELAMNERRVTVDAHLYEGQYFLSEENNWKAARMHFDYAISFCNNIAQKCIAYEASARAMAKFGHAQIADNYWTQAMDEFPHEMSNKCGAYQYEQQHYDVALEMFDDVLDPGRERPQSESEGESEGESSRVRVRVRPRPKKSQRARMDDLLLAMVFKAKILTDLEQYKSALKLLSKVMFVNPMIEAVILDVVENLIHLKQFKKAQQLCKTSMEMIHMNGGSDGGVEAGGGADGDGDADAGGDAMAKFAGKTVKQRGYMLSMCNAMINGYLVKEDIANGTDLLTRDERDVYLSEAHATIFDFCKENANDFWVNYNAAKFYHYVCCEMEMEMDMDMDMGVSADINANTNKNVGMGMGIGMGMNMDRSMFSEKADKYYRAALQIEDSFACVHYDYAQYLFKVGDEGKARKTLSTAFAKNPKIPRIQKLYHKVFHDS